MGGAHIRQSGFLNRSGDEDILKFQTCRAQNDLLSHQPACLMTPVSVPTTTRAGVSVYPSPWTAARTTWLAAVWTAALTDQPYGLFHPHNRRYNPLSWSKHFPLLLQLLWLSAALRISPVQPGSGGLLKYVAFIIPYLDPKSDHNSRSSRHPEEPPAG